MPVQSGRCRVGVVIDDTAYFTVHGFSSNGNGNDMPGLVNRIRTQMALAGLDWVVMGDFNREPDQLRTGLNATPPSNGTVITDAPFDPARAQEEAQEWKLYAMPEYNGYVRLLSRISGHYLGQEGGARNSRVVQWPRESPDQLWLPTYQGDGIWTLRNQVTGQMLTAQAGGAAVVGRDFDDSAAQRWFLQNPQTVTGAVELGLAEPTTTTQFVVDVRRAETAEDTPAVLGQPRRR
ncbi:RICIN domain-containing protein [Nonomuraea sp. NPDC050643]|uniref:RICIN domain-containing protein n=1 Tax=Nonomuraea sp. NPDC050643 TaxID=3155660 RepID=UPI0033DD29B3